MKLFGRTSGYYLFWTGFVYFWAGMYLAFTHTAPPEFATLGFVLALSVPLWCPPVAQHFNMEPLMFNLFSKKNKTPSNVIPFPEQKETTEYGGGDGGGYLPPKPKEPAVTYYTLGMTSENRLELKIGHSAITMNHDGLVNLMKQLEVFREQLAEYEGKEDDAV